MAAQGTPAPCLAMSRQTDGCLGVATALHHSAQRPRPVVEVPSEEVEGELYDVPRHQKPPPSGTRPAALREPVPQWGALTVGHVAAPALLASPVLAGGDGLDASTLSFLGGQDVLEQEEEARRRQEERLGAQVAEKLVELVDQRTGRTYFWNTSTFASS